MYLGFEHCFLCFFLFVFLGLFIYINYLIVQPFSLFFLVDVFFNNFACCYVLFGLQFSERPFWICVFS